MGGSAPGEHQQHSSTQEYILDHTNDRSPGQQATCMTGTPQSKGKPLDMCRIDALIYRSI